MEKPLPLNLAAETASGVILNPFQYRRYVADTDMGKIGGSHVIPKLDQADICSTVVGWLAGVSMDINCSCSG